MTSRRLPPHSPTARSLRPSTYAAPAQVAPAGWTRKTFALAMHLTCLALFGLIVVWPVASPIASGELEREFKPVLEALAGWTR